jgi:trimeric autotransporter adhesin
MRANSGTPISDWLRGNLLGLVAIFIALSGTAYALDGPLPGQNQVGSEDIINGEVKNGDIGAFEVKANNVAPDSLGGTKIADRSVKNADLGLGASSSNTIADGGIQGIDVKNNTLTGAQIDEGTLAGLWKLGGNAGTGGGDFLGTTDNQPFNLSVNDSRALRLEPASDGTNQSPNVIGGIADNSVTSGVHAATIGGGGRSDPARPASANRVTDDYGTVGGGGNNQAGDAAGTVDDETFATVGGGSGNTASGQGATVGGGSGNAAQGDFSAAGGGGGNAASATGATVSGGESNQASGHGSAVPGGFSNTAQGDFSLAAGLGAQANHNGAFVWADSNSFNFASTAQDQFSVRSTGGARLVSGIDGSGNPTAGLELPAGVSGWSTVANGEPFDIRVNGARGLRIDPAFDGFNQSPNVIGGIADNSVTSGVYAATIAGGGRWDPTQPGSANQVTDDYGTVGGGGNNQAGDAAGAVSDRTYATVSGGRDNTASGQGATIGGGSLNTASGDGATVAGGNANIAGGIQATVLGGSSNAAAGFNSVAGGSGAKANHNGAFVWADRSGFEFASTAANQFSVRATGGTRFVSSVDGSGTPNAGVQLVPGGGSWSSLSDRASKRALEPVSGRGVLRELDSVPISTWSYRAQDDSIRHIGPMAQDFYRAFGVGEDRRHIASVDADGVALAAIKGLTKKVDRLRRKVASLSQRLGSR